MDALPSRADVVVIGGGAIGLSAAYALSRRGVSVVVLERHQLGSGASIGNACMVTPSHAERTAAPAALRDGLRYLFDGKAPLKLRGRPSELSWVARFVAASRSTTSANEGTVRLRALAVRSTMLHQEWSERLGTGLVMKGTLILWSGPGAAAARATVVAEQRAAGFTIQELDAAAIAMLEPSVRNATHGALSTDDGHVDSAVFIERLAEGIRAEGDTIIEGVDVLEIDRSGAAVRLETTRGVLECERVVVAAGVWSRRFADELETSLPITPAKGYHVEFAGAATDVQRPIYFSEAHCVATPLAGRLRIAGTLEIGTDPDTIDRQRVLALREAAQRNLVGIPDQPSSIWMGQRPLSADSMPLIGPLAHDARVIIATGHGTLGITLAPVTGELVADFVTTASTVVDPLLDPNRFR